MEHVLTIKNILRRIIPGFVADEASALVEVTLVHYNDGILAIFIRIEESGTQALLLLNLVSSLPRPIGLLTNVLTRPSKNFPKNLRVTTY
jgi:hypothetical protein